MKISQNHNKVKKASLKNEMVDHIDEILNAAETMNSLNFFTIELKVHEGQIQANCTLKNRKKVY